MIWKRYSFHCFFNCLFLKFYDFEYASIFYVKKLLFWIFFLIFFNSNISKKQDHINIDRIQETKQNNTGKNSIKSITRSFNIVKLHLAKLIR